MPVPDFQSLMLPVLRAAADGEPAMVEIRERVAAALSLGEDDLAQMLPSGRQTTFANRVAWAKSFMEGAGLVHSVRRGVVRITERGRQVLGENLIRVDVAYLRRFSEFRAWQAKSHAKTGDSGATEVVPDPTSADSGTPDDRIEAIHASLTNALRADLLTRIVASPWQKFEQLVVDLLVALGYGGGRAEMARAFTKSGDDGIDGVVKEDALGLDVVYVQAKRLAIGSSVSRPTVQAFVGSLEGNRADKGVLVTTAFFSQPAREYVERISKRVVLIDGDELATLLVGHDVAVRTAARYEIKRVDEDYFVE